jgi:hypothetical protein
VTRIDPGVVSLANELRGHERQAAEELEQMSQALNRLRAMVSLPKYSTPMPRPPTSPAAPAGFSAGTTKARSRQAGDPHRPRSGLAGRRTARPRAPAAEELASGRPASRSASPATPRRLRRSRRPC